MRTLPLALVLLVASPAAAQEMAARETPELVVVARVVNDAGPWTHCGRLHVLGEVEVETIRVELGALTETRFVVVINCPSFRFTAGQELRLGLRTQRRASTGSVLGNRPPPELRRLYSTRFVLAAAPADIASLMGRRRAWMAHRFPHTRVDGDWTHYGDVLAVRFENERVVEVRGSVPAGTGSCADAARWAGFGEAGPPLRRRTGCEWPGISERHRLAPGVVGGIADGVFWARRGAAR